jgi:hypothetical protein
MSNIVYHSIEPENKRDEYVEYNQLSFNMDFQGRKIDPNTVRLVGQLVKSDADILNNDIGTHSLIDTVSVSFDGLGGLVEEIPDYGHYVVKHMITHKTSDEVGYNSGTLASLCSGDSIPIQTVLQGGNDLEADGNATLDFSVKPMICLNNMVSGSLNYSKVQTGRVVIRLSPVGKALFRTDNFDDNDENTTEPEFTYTIKDLRLNFTTLPEDGNNGPIIMETVQTVKSVLQSKNDSLNATVVGNIRNVSVSFQKQSNENQQNHDEYKTELINGVNRLQFLWNDATNSIITYEMKTPQEILERFIRSMNSGRLNHNQLGVMSRANSRGYGVGLDFGSFIELESNKVRIVIDSDLEDKMNAYMCFKTLVSF